MNSVFYVLIVAIVTALQLCPLPLLARFGRAGGAVVWHLDRRHRKVVLQNLRGAFKEKTEPELAAIGSETMKRIGENALCAIKTAGLTLEQLRQICLVTGLEKLPDFTKADAPKNCIGAIGHFGNFELYVMLGRLIPGLQPAATYRGMNSPVLNAVVQMMRERSGCRFFERRSEGIALREALNQGGLLLGLLSDQRPNRGGVWGPFLGRPCATTSAPALFALRYSAVLFPMICYRVGLGRWSIEIGDEIAIHQDGQPRSVEAITTEINKVFEVAVQRDPANWFWVHERWKITAAKPPINGVAAERQPDGLRAEPASL
jgi:lauroyl/myristoyl acyltransferase